MATELGGWLKSHRKWGLTSLATQRNAGAGEEAVLVARAGLGRSRENPGPVVLTKSTFLWRKWDSQLSYWLPL